MNSNVKQIVIVSVICAIILGLVLGLVFFFKKKKKNGNGGNGPPGQYIGVINKVANPFYVVMIGGQYLYGKSPSNLVTSSGCTSIKWASSSDLYMAWPKGNQLGTFTRWALSYKARPVPITNITHGGGTAGSYQNVNVYQNYIWKGDPTQSGMYQMVVELVNGSKMSGPNSGIVSGYANLCNNCLEGNTSMFITILQTEWSKFQSWAGGVNIGIAQNTLVCNTTLPAGIWYGDGYNTTTLPPNLMWASKNDVQKVAKTINFNKDSLIEAGLYYTLDTSGNITPKSPPPYQKSQQTL